MKVMTMGFVCDGWEEHDTDDERDCEHCQYWEVRGGECKNPDSEYLESTRHYKDQCDHWKEWQPWKN